MAFNQAERQGACFALCAYTIWGLAPLYFKSVGAVDPLEIIAHRVTWSAALLVGILALLGKLKELRIEGKTLGLLMVSTTLLACNWFIFVFAVLNGQIIETSLGYFINPLVSVFLGLLFLGERLRSTQWIALAIALTGVLIQLVFLGKIPLISLALALSFGFYGLIRKRMNLPSVSGLTMETLLALPFALGYLAYRHQMGNLAFSNGSFNLDLLLMLGGAITAMPLLFFASAVVRLSLTALGIFQYLAPSLALMLAIFFFDEPFSMVQLISFVYVWISIVIFTAEAFHHHRAPPPAH